MGLTARMPIEVIKATFAEHPNIMFYGFEPRPCVRLVFEDLKIDNFVFIPKAVWNKNESHIMYMGGTGGQGSSLVSSSRRRSQGEIVECIDISEWVRSHLNQSDHNVMRCDVEGSEFVILPHLIHTGAIDYFREIYVEWHRGKFVGPIEEIYSEVVSYCAANNIKLATLQTEWWLSVDAIVNNLK